MEVYGELYCFVPIFNNILFAILFLTVSFSYLASKSNNSKLAKIYIFIVILLLTCVAGFRGETVGIDTHRYLEVIENIEYYIGTYRINLRDGICLLCNFSYNDNKKSSNCFVYKCINNKFFNNS